MIETTNKQILESVEALSSLNGSLMDIIGALQVSCAITHIDNALKNYERSRDLLFDKYSNKSDDTNNVDIDETKIEELESEHTLLLTDTVVLDIDRIPVSDLVGVQIKPSTVAYVLWLIET